MRRRKLRQLSIAGPSLASGKVGAIRMESVAFIALRGRLSSAWCVEARGAGVFYPRNWPSTTVEQFIQALDSYIRWYRIKISLGSLSPVEYRRRLGIFA